MLAAFAALMISINWLVFIWAVINKSVVDSSLGYFINPLFSVLIGVFIFKEKLVSVQWLAISVAAIGIVISAYSSERLWVALVLATSFSIYGAIKKETRMPAIAGLGVETAILAPIALFYVMLQMSSRDTFYSGNSFALLMLGGPVTTLPLVLFAAAAKHVPMVYMGMMQYVGPTLQFILGWFLFGETINPWRLMGFSLVWLALAIFSVHAIVQYRRSQLLAPVS